MSHFSVMVRVPGSTPKDKLEEAIEQVLAPYCEHSGDNGEYKKFMVFQDEEDEYRQEYEEEGTEMVVLADGSFAYPWDDRFRVPGTIGQGSDTHKVPDHLTKRVVLFKERWDTFEAFVEGWHSHKERDPVHKRYGYYRNPNAKWDYWRIGGRWRGDLYVKPNASSEAGLGEVGYEYSMRHHEGPVPGSATEVDYCRINMLDFDRIHEEAKTRATKFWEQVDKFLKGEKFDLFEGPRDTMIRLGMLDCKDAPELTGKEYWTQKWPRQNTPGVDRFDVVAEKPDPRKDGVRVLSHMNPIRPWAYVDDKGWCEPGKMGWWGMASDTPDGNDKHAKDFNEWLRSGDQSDWIITVDCHI